jgi:uncharacterized protein YjbJ (UPF0337 family)
LTRRYSATYRATKNKEAAVRSITILAAFAAASLVASPVVYAQTSSTTTTMTTVKTDSNAIWQKMKGSWNTAKGAVKEQWGKLTDDDLMEIQGRRDQLVGKIQMRYGVSQEQAEAQVSGWEHKQKSL